MRAFFTPKRLLIGFGALLGVLVLCAVLFVVFFPKGLAIAEMERQVERATDRDLTIAGEVDLTFWPALGFSAEQVSLSNPEGFAEGSQFLEANRIVFAVALIPLLGGDIQVKSLILEGADLRLAAQPDGAVNWTFPTDETEERATLEDLRLDDVRLVGSRISFDAGDGKGETVLENADASLSIESLDKPGNFRGAFDYRGERANFDLGFALPRAIIEQGATPIQAQLRSDALNADLDGDFNSATGALSGQLQSNGASLRDLMAWMGSPMPAGDGFGAFRLDAAMQQEGVRTTLQNAAIKLDDIEASGNLVLEALADGRMRVSGALSSPEIDLNDYLPEPAQGAGGAGVEVDTAWNNDPIDMTGLRAVDADLALSIAALKFQRMSFTNAELALRINEGAADAQLTRLALYGGAGTARLIADARNATPRIALDLDLQNVNALPLLTDAIGFDKLEGRGRLRAQIAAQGASQAAIMRALAGTASFNFNDGAIKGVNLAQVARSVEQLRSGQQTTEAGGAQTDFAELAASFVLANGAAATEDLRLLNPFIRLDGQGIINAGAQTIDMRIAPRAVRSIEGQGGDATVAGLGIPFRITGPWTRVNFRPAVEEVVTNVVREQAQRALENTDPTSPLGMLGAAIFGRRAPTAEAPAPAAEAPAAEAPAADAPSETPTEEAPAEAEPEPTNPFERLLRGVK